jgi:isopenicillin N synthase-like dioxygenase
MTDQFGVKREITLEKYQFNVAQLETINFEQLINQDTNELEKLGQNSHSPGFFYLDLNGNEEYLDNLRGIYNVARTYFAQPTEIKMKDYRQFDPRG